MSFPSKLINVSNWRGLLYQKKRHFFLSSILLMTTSTKSISIRATLSLWEIVFLTLPIFINAIYIKLLHDVVFVYLKVCMFSHICMFIHACVCVCVCVCASFFFTCVTESIRSICECLYVFVYLYVYPCLCLCVCVCFFFTCVTESNRSICAYTDRSVNVYMYSICLCMHISLHVHINAGVKLASDRRIRFLSHRSRQVSLNRKKNIVLSIDGMGVWFGWCVCVCAQFG
jgi:hypothetical protein